MIGELNSFEIINYTHFIDRKEKIVVTCYLNYVYVPGTFKPGSDK